MGTVGQPRCEASSLKAQPNRLGCLKSWEYVDTIASPFRGILLTAFCKQMVEQNGCNKPLFKRITPLWSNPLGNPFEYTPLKRTTPWKKPPYSKPLQQTPGKNPLGATPWSKKPPSTRRKPAAWRAKATWTSRAAAWCTSRAGSRRWRARWYWGLARAAS